MKVYLFFFLLSVTCFACAQKVIISGKEGNRLLKWDDFRGVPDASNPFFAMTYWKISYQTGEVKPSGDSLIAAVEVVLTLDPKGSWVKAGKATAPLLVHEQGHFNIAVMCMHEMIGKFRNASYTKANIGNTLQTIFSTTLKKYTDLQDKYDAETDHSQNETAQEKWDQFFLKQSDLLKK